MQKDLSRTIFATVDGTDYKISEPRPFEPKWFGHKHEGARLRYEICICATRGWVVWTNGPFPCGFYSDLRIFRRDLKQVLL